VRSFDYLVAEQFDSALAEYGEGKAALKAGGVDLLDLIKEGVEAPATLLSIDGLDEFRYIRQADDGVHIGCLTTLADISRNDLLKTKYAVLHHAAAEAATPQIRERATVGGNLCQRPRCWYLRRGVSCLKNGGTDCPAREGENQYHAILDGGPCYIVHPSDPAVALTALEARVEVLGRGTSREIPLEELYVLPRERLDHETVLQQGEFIGSVILPANSSKTPQLYRKTMQREAWDFALVSIAAVRRDDSVRMVLGGVAPRPWRVPSSVEEDVASGGLDEDSIAALAERALYDAEPLSKNGYKVDVAASLIRDAIRALTA